MKDKNILVGRMVRSTIIVGILFWIFFHNAGIARIMVIPFITCGLFSIGQSVCLLVNKKKYATVLHKLFIISFLTFWFGFLIFWSYLVVKEKNYFVLLFTIPFWIVGIYVIRKFLLGIEPKAASKNSNVAIHFKTIISSFLVGVILLIGLVCLFIGIKDTLKLNKETENYRQTKGYLVDYEIYHSNGKETTYQLIYAYEVEGVQYTVTTDYGIGYIPKENSKQKVKYNPNNPKEAILEGTNSKNFLIYFGTFFTLGAIAFILVALSIKGYFDKIKIDIIGLYLGFVFLIVGIGFIVWQGGITISFFETIKKLGVWLLVPILFIIVGIIQIIKCILKIVK